jgi:hypothetical protein
MCFWITLIFLVILLFATTPMFPYSRGWGYFPFGGILVLVLILLLLWYWAWLPGWYYYHGPR